MANIQKRGEGKWFLTVMAGKGADGKYIRRTRTVTCKTKKDAELLWAQFKIEVEAGAYIAPDKMTLAAFVGEWQAKYASTRLEAKTQELYMYHLNRRILPAFGHRRIDSFKTYELVSYFESKDAQKRIDGEGELSGSTMAFIYRVFKNLFTRATEWKIIKENPMDGVKRPKEETKEVVAYDKEQVSLLIEALTKEPLPWRTFIMVAITCGLRLGELLGLEWSHIDLDHGTLEVRQSVTHLKGDGYRVKSPKSKSGKRVMVIPTPLLPLLREHKRECAKNRLKVADLWDGGDRYFIFSTYRGHALNPSNVQKRWKNFLIESGLPHINFHALRHTSATFMLMQGAPTKAISQRLGHSRTSVTEQVYMHVLREVDQAAADTFNTLFEPKPSSKGGAI